ncbi:MAG: EamA family transporter [Lachnospiraceae bacterium]|nr:EamA family transporter [Lachnospiraceae bacterium]
MNYSVLIVIASTFVAGFSQILLKKSSMRTYPNWIKEYLNWYVIIGYGMMFISLFLTMIAYKGFEDFTNVPLLESVGYIIVMILGRLFFKEKITMRKFIGIVVIMSGIFVYYMVN